MNVARLLLAHDFQRIAYEASRGNLTAVDLRKFAEPYSREEITVNGEPYLIRYFLRGQKGGDGYRLLLHNFLAGDEDRRPHNHPWLWAESVILHGGYEEQRVVGLSEREVTYEQALYQAGSRHTLSGLDFHRVYDVQPNTWTLFQHGPRSKEWGFLEITTDEDGKLTYAVDNYVSGKGPHAKQED